MILAKMYWSLDIDMIRKDSSEIVASVSGIVATYERPELLDEMLDSFWRNFPGLRFVVADNSVNKYSRNDVEYISVQAGSGISTSRNLAIERVETPYTMLVDDDTYCISETRLSSMLDFLTKNNLDIVAGNQFEEREADRFFFHGSYQIQNDSRKRKILFHYVELPNDKPYSKDLFLFDVTPNFFIGRTDVIKELRWDDKLKFACEHDDFFIRAMLAGKKVAYISESELLNRVSEKHHGGNLGEESLRSFLEKWQIDDKIEVRWIRTPQSRLSFYSIAQHQCIQPTRSEYLAACVQFKRFFSDFDL